ncbi:MAG: 50S ribosomal protein L4 [Planctomycetota bacterium]|nr:50S ribosomal protein L4 [Planctomycetota bacterium]
MIELKVYDRQGNVVETMHFDESCLGRFINYTLLHAAIVRYEANQRQGTVNTKDIRAVVGTTRKPYAQKHTGRARQGTRRRVGSRKGATCHGPHPRDHRQDMPTQARRAALRSALLGKFRGGEVMVVDNLHLPQPKTKEMAKTLKNLKIDGRCLIIIEQPNALLWRSVRNIPAVALNTLRDLNAYQVLKHRQILFTKAALQALPQEIKR